MINNREYFKALMKEEKLVLTQKRNIFGEIKKLIVCKHEKLSD